MNSVEWNEDAKEDALRTLDRWGKWIGIQRNGEGGGTDYSRHKRNEKEEEK